MNFCASHRSFSRSGKIMTTKKKNLNTFFCDGYNKAYQSEQIKIKKNLAKLSDASWCFPKRCAFNNKMMAQNCTASSVTTDGESENAQVGFWTQFHFTHGNEHRVLSFCPKWFLIECCEKHNAHSRGQKQALIRWWMAQTHRRTDASKDGQCQTKTKGRGESLWDAWGGGERGRRGKYEWEGWMIILPLRGSRRFFWRI